MGTVTASEILVESAVLAAATVIAVLVYRAMARPRLRLGRDPISGEWRATLRDTVQYAISVPFLVLGWATALVAVLVAVRSDMRGGDILVVASAIVIASRFLAHVFGDAAHELAKTVPLTLVTLVLIRGDMRDFDSFQSLVNDVASVQETFAAVVVTLTVDYAFTAGWYWIGVRGLALRGHRVPGVPAQSPQPSR